MSLNPDSLDQIFRMLTPSDMAGRLTLPYGLRNDPKKAQSLAVLIIDLIMNVDDRGAFRSTDIITKLGDWKPVDSTDTVDKIIRVHTTDGNKSSVELKANQSIDDYKKKKPPSQCNLTSAIGLDPSTASSPISIIFCDTPLIQPCMRDAHNVALFMNSVPSHIMSMAVPFLDVQFTFDRQKFTTNTPHAPSVLRFLYGDRTHQPPQSKEDNVIAGSLVRTKDLDSGNVAFQESTYIDVFCSPQTMVNMKNLGEASHYSEILDPTRPFASLESLIVNTSPTTGFGTYRKATLTFKLHDRSRLADIADLIRPHDLGGATVWIEYGWSFPTNIDGKDKSSGLGYSDLINSMRSPRQAYGVSNCSVSTDAAGQCSISLELFTKAQKYIRKFDIRINSLKEIYAVIDEAVTYLKDNRSRRGLDKPEGQTRDIKAYQLLDSACSNSGINMDDKELKAAFIEVKKMINGSSQGTEKDPFKTVDEFLLKLKKVSGVDAKDSFKEQVKTNATSYIKQKIDSIQKYDPWLPMTESDPFYVPVSRYIKGSVKDYVDVDKVKKTGGVTDITGVCSLAKLLSIFCLDPMKEMGNEVQMIFYTFNDYAGFEASSQNIGLFPIEVPVFVDKFYKRLTSLGKDTMTIEEFLGFVLKQIISDNFALGYGLREFYTPYDGSETHEVSTKQPTGKGVNSNKPTYESLITQFQQKKDKPWKTPNIEFYIESLQERKTSQSDPTPERIKEVTRIHVYDRYAEPFQEVISTLASVDSPASGDSSVSKGDTTNDKASFFSVLSSVSSSVQSLIKKIQLDPTSQNAYKLASGMTSREWKDIAASLIPTITYGANSSGVFEATLSTKADALLSAANLVRQSRQPQNLLQPNGAGTSNLPMNVVPATLSVTMFGCPKLRPVQRYFFDFNTGTSMDNAYIVTTTTDTINPGHFSTAAQLSYTDGYASFRSPNALINELQRQNLFMTRAVQDTDPSPGNPAPKR